MDMHMHICSFLCGQCPVGSSTQAQAQVLFRVVQQTPVVQVHEDGHRLAQDQRQPDDDVSGTAALNKKGLLFFGWVAFVAAVWTDWP